MYNRKIPLDTSCGLDLLAEVLFGKWKIKLLYYISEGIKRPNELHKQMPEATPRVLNIQLKQLLEHELISKQEYEQLPPKVEYSITDFANTLIPHIKAIGEWGDSNREQLCRMIEKSRKPKESSGE